jgi:hypothetical protein
MALVVVRQVVGTGRISNEQVTRGGIDPHDERFCLSGLMRGQARHEAATSLENWRAVVLRRRLDTGQCEPHGAHVVKSSRQLEIFVHLRPTIILC